MDTYEATKIVMSRIQKLDQENASKIMGYILIQDQGEKEIIRLAFGSEALLISYINHAKSCLGLSSTSSTHFSVNSFPPQTSPRIPILNNGSFPTNIPKPISYASVLNGTNTTSSSSSNNSLNSSILHFYVGNDEFLSGSGGHQVQDHLSFFDETVMDPIISPSGRSDSLIFPYGEDVNTISSPHPFHRRSCSVNDAAFIEEMGNERGFGWRPCVYYAKGFCKNGPNCKFLHSDDVIEVNKSVSEFDELLRMKALQQQRFALMASENHHPFGYSKSLNFVNENQRSVAASLMMGDDFHKFTRTRSEKYDFTPIGLGVSSTSRQIYLTFPSESTFKEEDVSGYFSLFGPVQDVRIPYQQKRMFGFVTFVYPETVKLILTKGNPHFVCDSRVLVKPYKEKGKVPDKKHLERGEYLTCLSPSGVDAREPFMLFNHSQEMMLRRKLEQEAELQNAIELQSRRMMNFQLMDMKKQHHNHHFVPNMSISSSPRQSSEIVNQEFSEDFDGSNESAKLPEASEDNTKSDLEGTESSSLKKSINNGNKKHDVNNTNDSDYLESLEHVLPDNLFASPTKLGASPTSSPLNMNSLNSCYFEMQRFSSGQEAVEM